MNKVLLTGFKPFLKNTINPSQILVEKISNELTVDSVILPVEFKNSFQILKKEIENKSINTVIMFGLAQSRKVICLERLALNWCSTDCADELGVIPVAGFISPLEPLVIETQVNLEDIIKSVNTESVQISYSAGTYVCNDLYYRALNELPGIRTLFVHVPSFNEMNLEKQMQNVKKIICKNII